MIIEFVAVIAIGFAAAGVAMLLRRATGNRLPRFATPAAAGLAMLGFTIWGEYSWYPRTAQALPADVPILSVHAEPSVFRPWTYLVPFVNRFSAVDLASARRNAALPDQVIVDVVLMGRHSASAKVPVMVDCAENRRADLVDGMAFDDTGALRDAHWHALGPDHPLIGHVCARPRDRRAR